jgi:lipopolysaccharide biosynthesis glycosyltransferase
MNISQKSIEADVHPLVVCLDDNYDKITGFFIFSLISQLSPEVRKLLLIYAVTFENCSLSFVKITCSDLNIQLNVISISDNDVKAKDFKHRGHISSAAFLKLLLPDLLPSTINSCVYADPDILIHSKADDIFTFKLDLDVIIASNIHEDMERDEFPPQDCFDGYNFSFHSGFMYINLMRARQMKFTQTCLDLLSITHQFGYADGEILVLACRERSLVQEVPATLHLVCDPVCLKNLNGNKPILVHLEGAGKPWNWPYGGEWRRLWRKQYRIWDPTFRLPKSSYWQFFVAKITSGIYKLSYPIYQILKKRTWPY